MIGIIYLILTVLLGNYYSNHYSFIGKKSKVMENIISVQNHADDIGWYW